MPFYSDACGFRMEYDVVNLRRALRSYFKQPVPPALISVRCRPHENARWASVPHSHDQASKLRREFEEWERSR